MLSFTSEHRKAADKKVFSNAEALIEELQARLHIEQAAVDLRRLMECSFEVARQEVRGEAEFRE